MLIHRLVAEYFDPFFRASFFTGYRDHHESRSYSNTTSIRTESVFSCGDCQARSQDLEKGGAILKE